jgi:nicotinate phosphoribosyltransferase
MFMCFIDSKNLHLTNSEREYLHQTCPYFQPAYLDYLENLRLHPDEQVTVDFVLKEPAKREENGNEDGCAQEEDAKDLGLIELGVKGLWRECILYEVPLMAIRESPTSHLLSLPSSEPVRRY